MTTRRRFLPPPLLAEAPSPPAGRTGRVEEPAGFAAAGACLGGAACFWAVAVPPPTNSVSVPAPLAALSAANASDSSTLEAAALASIPAAFSAARRSLLATPCALAISSTRFFVTLATQPPRRPAVPRARPGRPRTRPPPRAPRRQPPPPAPPPGVGRRWQRPAPRRLPRPPPRRPRPRRR